MNISQNAPISDMLYTVPTLLKWMF